MDHQRDSKPILLATYMAGFTDRGLTADAERPICMSLWVAFFSRVLSADAAYILAVSADDQSVTLKPD